MGTAVDIGSQEEKTPLSPAKVHKGDMMAFIYYGCVKGKDKNGFPTQTRLEVMDVDRNSPFFVTGDELVQASMWADQYSAEVSITRTELAQILVHSFNRPFSVNFEKKDGSNRTLRGRLINSEHLMGRSMVEDLDIDVNDHRLRQVDHRTLNWMIVNNIKYTVK